MTPDYDDIAKRLEAAKKKYGKPEDAPGYWTVASLIECLRKYPQDAVILGHALTYSARGGLRVCSDNDADPTKATVVDIEVLE